MCENTQMYREKADNASCVAMKDRGDKLVKVAEFFHQQTSQRCSNVRGRVADRIDYDFYHVLQPLKKTILSTNYPLYHRSCIKKINISYELHTANFQYLKKNYYIH